MREENDTALPARWALLGLGLLLAFNAAFTPGFFPVAWTDGRLVGVPIDILSHTGRVGVVALGMALVIATGGVDLSVGAIAAIAGAVVAQVMSRGHAHWGVGVAAALGAGLVCGLWNGALVAFARLQPLVATLILMVAGRGVAQLLSDGMIVTLSEPRFAMIGNGAFLGLPVAWVVLLAAVGGLWLARRFTVMGEFVEALGDNPAAARMVGLPVAGLTLGVYGLCGLLAGWAGVVECSYIQAADANNAGAQLELDAILGVVLGGASLRGGRVSLWGAVLGTLLMRVLTTTLVTRNVPPELAPIPKALGVLLICVLRSGPLRDAVSRWRHSGRPA